MSPAIEEATVSAISDWIIESALVGIDADRLVKGFCERLNEAGIPVARVHVACSFLHPMFRAFSVTWSSTRGVERSRFTHAGGNTSAWLSSPFKALLDENRQEMRFRIYKKEGLNQFPVLQEFREQGYTDYLTCTIPFTWPVEKANDMLDGALTSWVTDQATGFTDAQLAVLRRLLPRLGIGLKTYVRELTTQNVLSAYLGTHAGERVLNGQVKLGDGEEINAAIWFSDLRGSTVSADQMPADQFLTRLNRYFDATAGAVLDHGGEVLRFIGDAVLAIFPIAGPGGAERATRMAVAAARDAVQRIARENENLPEEDPVPLEFGLGLHVGDVLYGNIGVQERVEFSVIGHTANEVARLQDLSKDLDRTIIASDAFSSLIQTDWESMGSHKLRGVAEPQPVYALRLT